MTRTQTIDLLRSQLPGFYSVEQVINLIEKLDDAPEVTPETLKRIEDNIMTELKDLHDRCQLVAEDDIELEFGHNGRTVEVTNVNVDFDAIRSAVSEELESAFASDEE
jgi:hypothetical protein